MLLTIFLAHRPYFQATLCGEEGLYAYAIEQMADGRAASFLMARGVDGTRYEEIAGHNLAGYLMPAGVYKILRAFHGPFADGMNGAIQKALLMRWSVYVFYLLALITAVCWLPKDRRMWGTFLIVAMAHLNLAFYAAPQVQYDGAITALLMLIFCGCVARGWTSDHGWIWVVIGTLIVSWGKIEYLFAAIGALGLMALWYREWSRSLMIVWAGLLGGILGSALHYWLAPDNFIGGLSLIHRIVDTTSGASSHGSLWSKLQGVLVYIVNQWAWLRELFFVLVVCVFVLWRDRRDAKAVTPLSVIALMSSVCVTAGYSLVAWPGDGFPRYFAPAFLLLPLALAHGRVERPRWKDRWPILSLVIVLVLSAGVVQGVMQRGGNPVSRYCQIFDEVGMLQWIVQNEGREFTQMQGGPAGFGFYSDTLPFVCCGSDVSLYTPEIDPRAPDLRLRRYRP